MPYFLFDGILAEGVEGTLQGEEARHMASVRRLKPGQTCRLQDSQGRRFEVMVRELQRNRIDFTAKKEIKPPAESRLKLVMLQALTKEKAVDWMIQKGTELGVSHLMFFQSHHSPTALQANKLAKQLERWQRIAWEACKQSERQFPPEIQYHASLQAGMDALSQAAQRWYLHPYTQGSFKLHTPAPANQMQVVLTGPEGGLAPEEEHLALNQDFAPICLGPRILRAETAFVAAATLMQFGFGDLTFPAALHETTQ